MNNYRIVSCDRRNNTVRSAIKSLGLSGTHSYEKFIPTTYLTGSPEQRLALLQGLLDTDSHVNDHGNIEYSTSSPQLAQDVQALVWSLGGSATITSKTPTYTYNGAKLVGRTSYRLSIGMTTCPFRIARKADKWKPRTKYQPLRGITSVARTGEAEMVCISVAAEDHLYITKDYIVTHNTICFADLIKKENVRTLVLAHRDELIEQSADKIGWILNGALGNRKGIGIVKAEINEVSANVICASVQTVQKEARCAQLGAFDFIIIDEAHHAVALSYRNILKWLGAMDENGPFVLGVTATPDRLDKIGLHNVFQECVYKLSIEDLIDRGVLADLRAIQIRLNLGLDDVDKVAGEFNLDQLDRKMFFANAPKHSLQAYKDHAQGLRTLIFTTSVAMAHEMAATFSAAGFPAKALDFKTPKDERRQMLKDFASGKLKVLANMGTLTEGFDDAGIECIIVARPMTGRGLYTQVIGRGTRKSPTKTECLILDLVDVTTKHKLVTTATLFGLPIKDVEKGVVSAKTEELKRRMQAANEADAAHIAKQIELFTQKRMTWIKTVSGYKIAIPTGFLEVVAVKDAYNVVKVEGMSRTILAEDLSLGYAQGVAEDFIRKLGGKVVSSGTAAPWKAQNASAAQLGILSKLGIAFAPGISAGEAATLLSKHYAVAR